MRAFVLCDANIFYPSRQYAVVIGETIENAIQALKAERLEHYPETEEQYETAVIRILKTDVPSLKLASLTDLLQSEWCEQDSLYAPTLILDQLPLILPKTSVIT